MQRLTTSKDRRSIGILLTRRTLSGSVQLVDKREDAMVEIRIIFLEVAALLLNMFVLP